ncbi:MAG: hypothetical protein R3190_06075 [Thermoanaerobaculia bacterium]|nr:hypothetical protein [Thermoanaerobaculia bacterium]
MTATSSRLRSGPLPLYGLGLFLLAALVVTPAAAADEDGVTFSRDIAPILQRSCQGCHRPESLAPMSLLTYREVRPWARSIRRRTALRDELGVMPPWFIERDVGIQGFKDDPSLSDDEIELIARWVEAGAPEGDPGDLPTPIDWSRADDWQIGEPDLVVSSREFEVPAEAPDWWGSLGAVPLPLDEDRYVAAIEYRERSRANGPSTRDTVGGLFVIHHAGPYIISPEGDVPGGFWPVHEVGRNADFFPAESGRLVKAGSTLLLPSVHLHANGTDTTARLEIGFKFHPRGYEPTKQTQFLFFGNGPDLDLAPMQADQRHDAYFTLPENTRVTVFEPHMHAAGVRMCLEATYGGTTWTLNCAGYDHSWVRVYQYEEHTAPLLPKGTILHLVGFFDNSPSNPNVSDPRNWSGSGHRSVDNMFINLMQGTYLSDEEFEAAVESRRRYLRSADAGNGHLACPLCGEEGFVPAAGGGGR